jgi:hypothetical protein
MNTNSKEYVEWVANVWRLNSERNKQIEQRNKSLEDLIAITEIEYGLYE